MHHNTKRSYWIHTRKPKERPNHLTKNDLQISCNRYKKLWKYLVLKQPVTKGNKILSSLYSIRATMTHTEETGSNTSKTKHFLKIAKTYIDEVGKIANKYVKQVNIFSNCFVLNLIIFEFSIHHINRERHTFLSNL